MIYLLIPYALIAGIIFFPFLKMTGDWRISIVLSAWWILSAPAIHVWDYVDTLGGNQ